MKKIFVVLIVIFVSCAGVKPYSKKYVYNYQLFPTGYIFDIPTELKLWMIVEDDFSTFIFKDQDSSFLYISYSGFFALKNLNNINIKHLDSNINKDHLNNLINENHFNVNPDIIKIEFDGFNSKKLFCKDMYYKSKYSYSHIIASYNEGIYIGYMNIDSNKVEKFNKIIYSILEVEMDSIKLDEMILLK